MKYEKFNLDEPIFQLEIRANGFTTQYIDYTLNNMFSIFENSGLQILYIVSDHTYIKCVWDGYKNDNFFGDISELTSELNRLIEKDVDISVNISNFIRILKLKYITNYENTEV